MNTLIAVLLAPAVGNGAAVALECLIDLLLLILLKLLHSPLDYCVCLGVGLCVGLEPLARVP